MKNFKKTTILLIATVLLALGVTACGSDQKASPPASATPSLGTIKIGMVGQTIGPVGVAINDGSYKAAGLDVEPVSFSAGADAVQALVGGSLDVFQGGYEHVLNQINNGLDVKAFALLNNSSSYQLLERSDSPVTQLADVKGQVLGVTKAGSLSDSTLKFILKEAKLDPVKDVKIVNAGTGATMSAALESKNIIAGMVSEPTSSLMISTGDYKILVDPSFDTAGLVLMGKSDWAKTNSQALKAFLAVTKKATEKSAADPAYAAKALKKWYPNLDDKVLLAAATNVFKRVPTDLKITKTGTDQVLQTKLEEKLIPKEITFEQGVDLSYLPQ
ncbi:MAG TPA: ABC transporter substrate-binding protein [Desulfosporosinus sp.]|nr:ABC transporter substrate-binding protein [Desulfosporosinus sp.]